MRALLVLAVLMVVLVAIREHRPDVRVTDHVLPGIEVPSVPITVSVPVSGNLSV